MAAASPSSSEAAAGSLRVSLRASVPGARATIPAGRVASVLMEPLYVGPAAALALDAGWGSVELADVGDGAPIPLVSYELPPAAEHRGGTCRVRADLAGVDAACRELAVAADPVVLLGAPAFARPLAARLAFEGFDAVEFVPIAADGGVSADAWWASGMLMRVLLDELDGREAVLDEAAGIAVSLVGDLADAAPALGAGRRWNAHLAAGGHPDDLRLACAVDSIGVVPRLHLPASLEAGASLRVRAW